MKKTSQAFNCRDITGQRFGNLVALEKIEDYQVKENYFSSIWRCKCDCGRSKIAKAHLLRYNKTRSCGCYLGKNPSHADDLTTNINNIFKRIKNSASRRSMEFSLDKELVYKLSQSNCFYCDAAPSNIFKYSRYKRDPISYNGLDRVDNKKDYIPTNVVTCCKTCNMAKRSMSFAEFLTWISRVHDHAFGPVITMTIR